MKHSYGIALCRYREDKKFNIRIPEIILVKKRLTYQFCSFALGNYKKTDIPNLMRMFNGMSMSEKRELESLDFSRIWSYLCADQHMFNNSMFLRSRNKFNSLTADGGIKLRKMLRNSVNVSAIWEIPKGKREANETELDAAVREFREETGITSNQYEIVWSAPPIVCTYIDQNVTYCNKYFIAHFKSPSSEQKNTFKSRQLLTYEHECSTEIEDVRWVSIQEIEYLGMVQNFRDRLIATVKTSIRIASKEGLRPSTHRSA